MQHSWPNTFGDWIPLEHWHSRPLRNRLRRPEGWRACREVCNLWRNARPAGIITCSIFRLPSGRETRRSHRSAAIRSSVNASRIEYRDQLEQQCCLSDQTREFLISGLTVSQLLPHRLDHLIGRNGGSATVVAKDKQNRCLQGHLPPGPAWLLLQPECPGPLPSGKQMEG